MDAPTSTAASTETHDDSTASGLDAFAEGNADGTGASESTAGETVTAEQPVTDGTAESDAASDGDPGADAREEFTGTVVQAGDPVILDDGRETRQVETDAELRLGQEVTVRGRVHDGRIDADDVL